METIKRGPIYDRMVSSNSELKSMRAEFVYDSLQAGQKRIIMDLEDEKRQIKMKMSMLEDFGPDTSDSLRPASKDFNPTSWLENMNQLEDDLAIVEEKLINRNAVYNRYFKSESEEQSAASPTQNA